MLEPERNASFLDGIRGFGQDLQKVGRFGQYGFRA